MIVARIEGFLENRQEVHVLAGLEDEVWQAFMEVWWEVWGDQRVGVDKLFDLATERNLLVNLRGGRTKFGASVAMGKVLMGRRDRRQGPWAIRLAGAGSGGVWQYRLENVEETRAVVAQKRELGLGPKNPHQTNHLYPDPEAKGGGNSGDSGDFPDLNPDIVKFPTTPSQLQHGAHFEDLKEDFRRPVH